MTRSVKLRLITAALIASAAPIVPVLGAEPAAVALLGGPTGLVRSEKEGPLEGMLVQLISDKTSIRTTVYTHKDGHYEFPKLQTGTYVLRIALPREYRPYFQKGIEINGATKLRNIVLQRVTEDTLLPPYPEIAAQMSGSEWLMSLPGTAEDKKIVTVNCSFCHSYQQIFRNRYDEDSWGKIVYRMTHGAGAPLINVNPRGRLSDEEETELVKWLATVRGPESKDPPFATLPRPTGESTNAIITEYELPRLEIATHDVAGDAEGNLWYSVHRTSDFGRLDPHTGKVTQYHPPLTPGAAPGTHWIYPDQNGIVWASENWTHNMIRLDPKTGVIRKIPWPTLTEINSPMGGNYALDKQGFIWECRENAVIKTDAATGVRAKMYPTKKFTQTYGAAISDDGRYFAGGAWPKDGIVILDINTGEVFEPETSKFSGPARGHFDKDDNYWVAARGGGLIKYDTKTHTVHEYPSPILYGTLYSVRPDKNGDVWGGSLMTGRYLRFDPKTEKFTQYLLPEPYSHDREPWIDNSTTPVSVWYVDHEGYMVHIQPLE